MKLASSSLLFVAASALVTGAFGVGCASKADDTGKATQNLSDGVDVPNPSGVYVAGVTANGTGCPAGSWNAQISDDGQSFLVTFQAYEATIWPGVAFSIKDCTVGINLKTPAGLSFAVTSFKHAGFGYLDKAGVTAKQTAKYYFMGNPVPARELQTSFAGPYDDAFVLEDEVAIADRVWSPCGTERTLNAQTRIILQNNSDKSGNGFFDTAAVAGHVDNQFLIGLAWQQCGDGVDAGPPDPGADAGTSSTDTTGNADTDAGAADPGAGTTDPGGDAPPAAPGDGPRGDNGAPADPDAGVYGGDRP